MSRHVQLSDVYRPRINALVEVV